MNEEFADVISVAGLTVDFSRTPLSQVLKQRSVSGGLAVQADLLNRGIERMFSGNLINVTEQRAVMHIALRDVFEPATEFSHSAKDVFNRVKVVAEKIRNGIWTGATGKPIKSVINIGIGGSDLGPRLICDALMPPSGEPGSVKTFFVANIDPVELNDALAQCEPETTLIILASKTFTTLETLENGRAAKQWMLNKIAVKNLSSHMIAVTANPANALAFGVDENNIFPFWEWVGGRYSLWSSIGLSIAITHGADTFEALLSGAHVMDQHFSSAPFERNLPALMALLDDHYVNDCDAHSIAVLPYSHRLRLLPDYLQQLCMESNGKQVRENGEPVLNRTCPIVWGCAGTVGQHSFYQLLHQGTEFVPVDFILPLSSGLSCNEDKRDLHLIANCLAQSKALQEGKSLEQARKEMEEADTGHRQAYYLARHRQVPGGKPNTIISLPTVDAVSLGSLIALYEHKVFALSLLWEINAFDQWGVELGKQLSLPIFTALNTQDIAENSSLDTITSRWVKRAREG